MKRWSAASTALGRHPESTPTPPQYCPPPLAGWQVGRRVYPSGRQCPIDRFHSPCAMPVPPARGSRQHARVPDIEWLRFQHGTNPLGTLDVWCRAYPGHRYISTKLAAGARLRWMGQVGSRSSTHEDDRRANPASQCHMVTEHIAWHAHPTTARPYPQPRKPHLRWSSPAASIQYESPSTNAAER